MGDPLAVQLTRVRQRFSAGEHALNAYLWIPEPSIVEIFGLAGFDSVTIDLEHVAWDATMIRQLIMAAELVGITPLARVPFEQRSVILPLLDTGLHGVEIPHVNSRAMAEEAAALVRFPPLGDRGAHGLTRAARYGEVPYAEHVHTSNDQVLLITTIEDVQGVENLEEIASVEGVDIVTVGPHDLAESMGVREPNDPRVRAIVQDIAARLRTLGKARFGFPIGFSQLPLSPEEAVELGVSYSTVLPPAERMLLDVLRGAVTAARSGPT
jgi:4-hydroxy-2-oxoheptanedioate aldolase